MSFSRVFVIRTVFSRFEFFGGFCSHSSELQSVGFYYLCYWPICFIDFESIECKRDGKTLPFGWQLRLCYTEVSSFLSQCNRLRKEVTFSSSCKCVNYSLILQILKLQWAFTTSSKDYFIWISTVRIIHSKF